MLFKKNFNCYVFIIVATVLLYLWQWRLYPMINPDGITYLESAAAYLTGGVKAVLAFGAQAEWPFYSICIASVHQFTGASIPTSERLLDGFFIILSACEFLYLTRVFSQHKAAYVWGIIIWLTWHSYVKWWPQVVRDHGFVASMLLSVICYYRFVVTRRFVWALAWSISMLIAEAFRIEAILYLALVPFSVFFLKDINRYQRAFLFLKLNILPIILIVIVAVLFLNHTLTLHSLRFAYIWQEFSRFYAAMANRFIDALALLHAKIFYRENDFVTYGLVASYVIIFIGYVISQISLAALPSLFFARYAWQRLNRIFLKPVFLPYLCIALITPLLFFVEHAFLNGRYLLPLGFLVLLFVASSVPYIIDFLSGKKRLFWIMLTGCLLGVNLLTNVICFGHVAAEDYVIGAWLQENYPQKTVFTNVKRIFYYTHFQLGQRDLIYQLNLSDINEAWLRQHNAWCLYDILVIESPIDQLSAWRQCFEQFQQKNALGAVVKSFTKARGQSEVLIVPINAVGCKKLVDSQPSFT